MIRWIPLTLVGVPLLCRAVPAGDMSQLASNSIQEASSIETMAQTDPMLGLSDQIADDGLIALINARATRIYASATSKPNPLNWVDKYCYSGPFGDLTALRKEVGGIVGDARYSNQLARALVESSACSLAYGQIRSGGYLPPATYSLKPIKEAIDNAKRK